MPLEKVRNIAGKTYKVQIGKVAKQSDSSVLLSCNGTTVLTTVVLANLPSLNLETLPLTVEYQERGYAAGRIPGGFFKREGRLRDHEIVISRLIDRTLRPLIPRYIEKEMLISSIVISWDGENLPDITACLSAIIALDLAGIPLSKQISCVRVGKIDENFVINPTYQQMEKSMFDLIVAGDGDEVTTISFDGAEIDDEEILTAVKFANNSIKEFIDFQQEIVNEFKPNKLAISFPVVEEKIQELIKILLPDSLQIYNVKTKKQKNQILENLLNTFSQRLTEFGYDENSKINPFFVFREEIEKYIRNHILNTKLRPDGRTYNQLREINCEVGILGQVHGSALFTRGETQSLSTATLGTFEDMILVEEIEEKYQDNFIFHYNFPGFATGETKPSRAPSRREIGHGSLAKKSIKPLLPTEDVFPYTIRIVSDILESNGSTSMASVCGGSLALFDAGVPMKSSVAGISIGLIKENTGYVILNDITGLEDQMGDMDFKVAGTQKGVTAIQLDIKIPTISLDILKEALENAKISRHEVLKIMDETMPSPRKNIPENAPRIVVLNIPPEKIGDLVGPGGKNIKQIIEDTGVKINIHPTGKLTVCGQDEPSVKSAIDMIEYLTADIEIGKIYKGKVTRVENYGVFVEIAPGKIGLAHISQLFYQRVRNIRDFINEGDEIVVKVIDIDKEGRIVLSRKAALK